MAHQNSLTQWVRAWLLPLIAIALLASVSVEVVQRWQRLHGTVVPAIVFQKLGKEGSGSSGRYNVVAKYQQPQGNTLHTRITTDRSTHSALLVGERIWVCYAHDPQNSLLASEWSFNGKSIIITLVSAVLLLSGLDANRNWRHRRRTGYLPN